MAEHANASRIRELFAAFRAGDVAAIDGAIADDAVWRFPGRRGQCVCAVAAGVELVAGAGRGGCDQTFVDIGGRRDSQGRTPDDLAHVDAVLVGAVHPTPDEFELRMIHHARDGGLADTPGSPLDDTNAHLRPPECFTRQRLKWHSMTR